MSKPITVEEANALAEFYLQVPIHRFLNARLKSLGQDCSEIIITTSPDLLTPTGTLHAGAIYAALELANVLAIVPHLHQSEYAATIDHSVSLMGTIAGNGKEVLVKSRMMKRGGTVGFFESEAYDAKNMALLAKGKTTKAIRKLPKGQTHEVAVRGGKSKL